MVDFIVHGREDTVGVAVRDVSAGEKLEGWNMETGETLEIVAVQQIPLGHKLAIKPVGAGQSVIKYNVPIGRAVTAIRAGEHVHTHNLKSARW